MGHNLCCCLSLSATTASHVNLEENVSFLKTTCQAPKFLAQAIPSFQTSLFLQCHSSTRSVLLLWPGTLL